MPQECQVNNFYLSIVGYQGFFFHMPVLFFFNLLILLLSTLISLINTMPCLAGILGFAFFMFLLADEK